MIIVTCIFYFIELDDVEYSMSLYSNLLPDGDAVFSISVYNRLYIEVNTPFQCSPYITDLILGSGGMPEATVQLHSLADSNTQACSVLRRSS